MTRKRDKHLKRVKEDREKELDDLRETQLKKLKTALRVAREYKGTNPDPMKWTEVMRQEIATSLDGDGGLDITRSKQRGKDYYRVRFSFKGSSKLPMFLAETYGGTVNPTGDSFVWNIGKRVKLVQALIVIKPYVRLKVEQIDVALKALMLLETKPEGWRDRLAELRKEMSRLNDTKNRKQRGREYFDATDPGAGR